MDRLVDRGLSLSLQIDTGHTLDCSVYELRTMTHDRTQIGSLVKQDEDVVTGEHRVSTRGGRSFFFDGPVLLCRAPTSSRTIYLLLGNLYVSHVIQ